MQRRVLVLGDDSRSALAVVRSLGRRGITVVLGVQDPQTVVAASRYAGRVVRLPGAGEPIDDWIGAVRNILEAERVDLLIPTADQALVPLVHHRVEFESLVRCAIPGDDAFELSYRKHRTIALARELGVPTPETAVVSTREDLCLLEARRPFEPPLIVKPGSSKVWVNGRAAELGVRLVRNWSDLRTYVAELLPMTPVLIQQFVAGTGVGLEFLAQRGEVLVAFQHERVHEPPRGGGSSYRRSAPLDPQLLAWSTSMLAAMQWTGVAMVEFKRDARDGRAALMEINGRFWGSLPLAIASGVDFPYYLYELLVNGRRPAPVSYRAGMYARNVLKDLEWMVENWQARPDDPYLMTVPKRRVVAEVGHVFLGRERWDTLTLDDPRPGVAELAAAAGPIAKRVAGAARRTAAAAWYAAPLWRRRQRSRLRRLIGGKPAVLLVCKGNVCRSPFAEIYLRRELVRQGLNGIGIRSAGYLPGCGQRGSPAEACAVAREFGLDLGPHRSVELTRELVDEAGVILCMEPEHVKTIGDAFGESSGKTLLLGAFGSSVSGGTIPDPWGEPDGTFRECYRLIASCADALVAQLARS